MTNEAEIYIFYVGETKMFYLGKHKYPKKYSSQSSNYTHSSKNDEFCKIVPDSRAPVNERREFLNNIPKGIKRRIIAKGTDKEMCELEVKLLDNRKKKCWNKYYNKKSHTKAIGNLNDVLSEENIILWKKNISKSLLGKPKKSKENYQWSKTKTDKERKEYFSRPLEQNGMWKGGISIGDNKQSFFDNDYKDRKKQCKELIEKGLSYYEVRENSKRLSICYPYHLLPQKEKDRRNKLARQRWSSSN